MIDKHLEMSSADLHQIDDERVEPDALYGWVGECLRCHFFGWMVAGVVPLQ